MAEAALQVRDLRKRFGDETILSIDSLSISKGEFVTVLGPSGCGKTTFINLLAGFLLPSSGRVLIDGRNIKGPQPKIGVVFQEYAVFPWKTVLQNIFLGMSYLGLGKDEMAKRSQELIGLVGLTGTEHHYPYQLSGGMKQRVAIARSLAQDPEVLLMDEPFGSLDAQMRERLQDELHSLHRRTGKTIVFVTHNIQEAIFLGERLLIFRKGKGSVVNDLIVRGLHDRMSLSFGEAERTVRRHLS